MKATSTDSPTPHSCPMCGHAHDGGARECASCGEPMAYNVWREEDIVIASRDDAHWPAVCILTGESAGEPNELKLRIRCGIWIYVVTFLAFLPPFMFVAAPILGMLFISKRFRNRKISLPISNTGLKKVKKRKRRLLVVLLAMSSFLLTLLLLSILPVNQAAPSDILNRLGLNMNQVNALLTTLGVVWFFSLLIGVPIAAINLVRLFHGDFGVQLLKIEDGKFHLKGAHPRLLELLPAYESPAVSGDKSSR